MNDGQQINVSMSQVQAMLAEKDLEILRLRTVLEQIEQNHRGREHGHGHEDEG